MATKKITIAIDEIIVNAIDARAKEAKRSRSNYLECAIEEHLKAEDKDKLLQDKINELEKKIKILKSAPIVSPVIVETKIEKQPKSEPTGFVTKIDNTIPDNF